MLFFIFQKVNDIFFIKLQKVNAIFIIFQKVNVVTNWCFISDINVRNVKTMLF